ncbi:uncharacterized protein MAM_06402 [Metarhizium album ARSEF 1941]|uniref:Uncharacterized protein n=1 Tax=Metarhizium album (strain ARSEF 1941) TaxID=1081103 RepID=A0A0B2WS66_METAS|nr:uncharacterized protein MAM_06402 [Metarhizium album ARSEF 1941]KHN95790.1 hypothetical protein MAM_06402 [Metarhizium album ARSEF 1941]
MDPTLKFAKSHLGLHENISLEQRHSSADRLSVATFPGMTRRLTVNHVVGLHDFPGPNLVVGLGRSSSKWSGTNLALQLDTSSKRLLWPLRQLANICRGAKTRYGYIQTEQEMVVCCFSKDGNEKWKVAMMPIPWTRSGVHMLTTDLALWWLCMLAMSAHHHRALVSELEMVKINAWNYVPLGQGRGLVRRHLYSNFEEPVSFPTSQVYMPGNGAANAAGESLAWPEANESLMDSLLGLGTSNGAHVPDSDPLGFGRTLGQGLSNVADGGKEENAGRKETSVYRAPEF